MAIGDVHATISSVIGSATLQIRPDIGDEWVIHNIFSSSSIDIVSVNGSNRCTFDTLIGPGALTAYFFHVTNTQYMELINKGSSTIECGYDGIETK